MLKSLDGSALALGAVVVGGSIASGRSLILGATYLAAAGIAGGLALLLLGPAIAAPRGSAAGTRVQRAGSLARVSVLAGWQLAALGLLSVLTTGAVPPLRLLALVLALVAVGVAVADRLLALADAPDSAGNRRPLRLLGVSGARRLFFWIFAVPVSLPFLLGGAVLFLSGPPYASAIYPPRLALAVSAFYVVVTAALVRQRYRGGRPAPPGLRLAAVVTVGLAAMALPFGLSWWPYCLSAISVFAVAESARWLVAALPARTPGPA
jgi:hypothetical protein